MESTASTDQVYIDAPCKAESVKCIAALWLQVQEGVLEADNVFWIICAHILILCACVHKLIPSLPKIIFWS